MLSSRPHDWIHPREFGHESTRDGGAFGGAVERLIDSYLQAPLFRLDWAGAATFFLLAIAIRDAWVRINAMREPRTFEEFWPVYVIAHSQPLTRVFHSVGTLAGWTVLIAAIVLRRPWLILAAFVVPYALAWFSHFFVEHNRPATFGHPLWSWLADQKMVAMVLAGKMGGEVERCAAHLQTPDHRPA